MRSLLHRPLYGDFPCMVAWAVLTLISLLMLLINYDKSQVGKRCKKSGTRSHHDLDLSELCSPKLVIPLTHG